MFLALAFKPFSEKRIGVVLRTEFIYNLPVWSHHMFSHPKHTPSLHRHRVYQSVITMIHARLVTSDWGEW